MGDQSEYVKGSDGSQILNALRERACRLSKEEDCDNCYPWQEESGGEWQNY